MTIDPDNNLKPDTRAYQVSVFPFRRCENARFEYAIFRRIRSGLWQAISGGARSGEFFIDAVKRECSEEAGIRESADYFSLQTINSVPIHFFTEQTPEGSYVIDEHWFAVDCTNMGIKLSQEHSEYRWVDYETAGQMLRWDSNKTALWELNQRLIDGNMISLKDHEEGAS